MMEYLVTCVNKHDQLNTHEHITHIGDVKGQAPWRMAREKAVAQIDAKIAAFYTVDRVTGYKVYIGVVRESGKAPYLRTYADGKWKDNLLALVECDSSCKLI